jgi:PKD repeat protein
MRSMWILAAGTLVLAACGSDNGGDVTGPPPPTNTPPVANFGATCTGLSCTFSDSSHDAEGSIKAWQWDFGDGSSSTDQNPVHDYATAQTYNATLTVTDSGGATNSVTKPVAPTAPTADLTCTDAATAGAPATCSFTLPQAAAIQAVMTDSIPCEAHGDSFVFTAPVVDTLTADGCFAPVGTQVQLAAAPAGTQVTFEIKSGLTQYMTAVQVSGQYPEWTLAVEDAVGAPFPPDFADMGVTLTVLPSTGP